MSPQIAERAFEEAIECGLLRHGPDALPPASAAEFIRTNFPTAVKAAPPADGPAST